MPSVCDDAFSKSKNLTVPKTDSRGMDIVLGVVNLIFFGIGTIIAGILSNDMADIVIGVCQLFIPFVGWVWSVIWGILMILGK